MIAPIRHSDPDSSEKHRLLSRARKAIASTLLESQPDRPLDPPPFPAWQVWLVAAWVVAVAAAIIAGMLGYL